MSFARKDNLPFRVSSVRRGYPARTVHPAPDLRPSSVGEAETFLWWLITLWYPRLRPSFSLFKDSFAKQSNPRAQAVLSCSVRLHRSKGNTAQIWKCLCVGQAAKQNHSHVIFSLGFEMLLQDTYTIYGVSKSPNLTSRVSNSQNYYLKGSETVSYILGCVSTPEWNAGKKHG